MTAETLNHHKKKLQLRALPLTRTAAREWIEQVHRHHKKASVCDIFRIACVDKNNPEEILGVMQVGRPVARLLATDNNLEVTRLAVKENCPNACSFMYARAARVGRELGYNIIYTYILQSESGASLRAAGWVEDGEAGGGSWDRPSRRRQAELFPQMRKVRYSKKLN